MDSDLLKFMEEFGKSWNDSTFKKLIFSKPTKNNDQINRIEVKLVEIKKEKMFSFVFEYTTKNITKNFFYNETKDQLSKLIEKQFKNMILFTKNYDIRLSYNKKMRSQIIYSKPTCKECNLREHNELKQRIITIENNIYLKELGVVNQNNILAQNMQSKYKQINKYIETIASVVKDAKLFKKEEIVVTDMGSGKGYLAFATYDFLKNISKINVNIIGVEIRKELVDLCNNISKKCGFENLYFHEGDINSFQITKIDILIALHACDTATDDAIYQGIKNDSSVIIVAPCCHKQIRKELRIDNELKYLTKHGILEERLAESITDTLRSLVLEIFGYKTQIFEFISDEHTHKNVMIVGVKNGSKIIRNTEIIEKLLNFKKLFGIKEFYLENLLKNEIHP